MKKIKSEFKSEKIQACILIDNNNEMSWCVYHQDDSSERLTFTKDLNELENIESFNNITEVEIEEHLNKYGFEIEPKEYFDDVLQFKELPVNYKLKLVNIELKKQYSISFKV